MTDNSKKIYPIGIQTFENIIKRNAIYVDKTDLVYKMVSEGNYYFLSRPRRFGKSLLLSTLESYFLGKKELFKGLAIENLEKEWETYPVLRIDFSLKKNISVKSVQNIMRDALDSWEDIYGNGTADKDDYAIRFKQVIEKAYNKTNLGVVILIDEYDAPLLDTMITKETFIEIRQVMRDFFSPLKSCEAKIKFV
ncbi:MAG: AAA family ATPase, partial [Bacteroidales bacterium]|nr:AAA family ATPase [Bacteroidales bacterium]